MRKPTAWSTRLARSGGRLSHSLRDGAGRSQSAQQPGEPGRRRRWDFKVTGTLNAGGTLIEAAGFHLTQLGEAQTRTTQSFNVRDVPFAQDSGRGAGGRRDLEFRLTGPNVQNHVSGITYSSTDSRGNVSTYAGTDWNSASIVPDLRITFLCPR